MTVNSRKSELFNSKEDYESAQQRLPYWARSTNPIVRRHLGLYWRTVPPQYEPFLMIFGVWTALMILGILIDGVFGVVMLSFIASLLVIPVALFFYGRVLLQVTRSTTHYMQAEMKNNTFRLLRTTPMSLPQIFLGKIAAGLWERMDDWVMSAQLALAFSAPVLFGMYSELWGPGLMAPALTLLGLVVLMARMLLEPVMLGVISVFVGLVVPGRSRAVTTSVVLGAFYFLLLNLTANLPFVRGTELPDGTLLPPNQTLIVLFDFVLPVLLPLILIGALLPLASRVVRD